MAKIFAADEGLAQFLSARAAGASPGELGALRRRLVAEGYGRGAPAKGPTEERDALTLDPGFDFRSLLSRK